MNLPVTIYPQSEFPDVYRWQALALMRATWPGIFQGDLRWVTQTYPPDLETTHFVVAHDEVLVAYGSMMLLRLPWAGADYRVAALGNILTSPPYRGEGHGRRLMAAATATIDQADADAGILFCNESLGPFYRQSGWELLEGSETRIGTPESYTIDHDLRMMRLVSERARQSRERLGREPLYVDWPW